MLDGKFKKAILKATNQLSLNLKTKELFLEIKKQPKLTKT